jgi:hypothetical protein
LENDELCQNDVLENNYNFNSKYQRSNNVKSEIISKVEKNDDFPINKNSIIELKNYKLRGSNSKNYESSNTNFVSTNLLNKDDNIINIVLNNKNNNWSFMKDLELDKRNSQQTIEQNQQQSNPCINIDNKYFDQYKQQAVNNRNDSKSKIDFNNNKNIQNQQFNQNNLPTSYAREKSYDLSTRNKQSLNKSFNSKFSKNIKVNIF